MVEEAVGGHQGGPGSENELDVVGSAVEGAGPVARSDISPTLYIARI